jgi:hypothetical protein
MERRLRRVKDAQEESEDDRRTRARSMLRHKKRPRNAVRAASLKI